MQWQYHPTIIAFFAGGFVALGIAALSWRSIRQHGATHLVAAICLLGIHDAIWTFAAAFKTAAVGLETKVLFYKLQFLGSWVAPSLTVVIAIAFVGWGQWLTRKTLGALAAVSVTGIVLVVLNPNDVMLAELVRVETQGVLALEHAFPPLFVLFLSWFLALATLSAAILAYGGATRIVPRAPALFGALVFLLPVVAVALKMGGIYPPNGDGINLTPATNAVSLSILSGVIVRYRVFELLPVGRHRAVERMDDGYVLVGSDETILDANRAAVDLLGAESKSAVTGTRVDNLVPVYDQCLDPGSSESVLFDRGDRTIEVKASSVDQNHRTTGHLLLLRDATERRRRKRNLEAANDRLEEFASTVSHDLRNPLEVAKGRVELERRTRSDTDNLTEATVALERIETLIEDVLTLARLGESIGDTERISLSEVANSAWAVIDAGEATLVVDDSFVFEGDRNRVQQLLENLFRNAVTHGGQDVTVRVGPLSERSGYYVVDDGTGIPDGDRDRVFETGYSTAADGTGYGLGIVVDIATAHGWDVTVVEGVEGGARFEITGVTGLD